MCTVKLLKNEGANIELFRKFKFPDGQNILVLGPNKMAVISEFTAKNKQKVVQYCEIEEVKHSPLFEKDENGELILDSNGEPFKIKDVREPQLMPSEDFCNEYLQKMADDWEKTFDEVVVVPNLI